MEVSESVKNYRVVMQWFVWLVALESVTGSAGTVLINELNVDTPGADTSEYIELWNSGSCKVNLDGYVLALYNGALETVTKYREFDLAGKCIAGNGYFLLSPITVTPSPDYTENTVSFIENGNSAADAVALYKGQFGSAPLLDSSSMFDLVDVIVYDTTLPSDNSAFMPSPLPEQDSVVEDASILPGDEAISRCSSEPKNMSSFAVGGLSPRAPNPCFPENIRKWPTPCQSTDFQEGQRRRKFYYKITEKMVGSSAVNVNFTARSSIQCSVKCSQDNMCTHFSYIPQHGGSHSCFLHYYCRTTTKFSSEGVVGEKHYRVSSENPVWPHESFV